MNKHILHDHLDGGLRPSTADDIAKKNNYKPLLEIEDIQSFFAVSYTHLRAHETV